jgi:hypothetical protein
LNQKASMANRGSNPGLPDSIALHYIRASTLSMETLFSQRRMIVPPVPRIPLRCIRATLADRPDLRRGRTGHGAGGTAAGPGALNRDRLSRKMIPTSLNTSA